MNQLPHKTVEVHIVGSGLSGLMMACQLAVHGIHFRIIDKKEHSSTYSGAFILQARSVEIFSQLGIVEKILQGAIIANNLSIVFNGKTKARISLKDIGKGLTKFPNLYLIEQSKTEQLLIDFIAAKGYSVERKTEMDSFTQDDTCVTSVLKLHDGAEEMLKTQYMIAADGGDSGVRAHLRIPFVGKRHPVSLFIIDCKAELDLPSDELCFSFSEDSTSGFFPMKEGKRRIDGVIPKELEGKKNIQFEDIEKKFAQRLRMKIRLYNPAWFSVSYSNQGCALSYQKNRCFLVGDAAHTFTPVGAQGMNTGLQDAYNLAWKLAFVLQGKAKSALLDTYYTERKNTAEKLVRSTGRIYTLVTSRTVFIKIFRLHLLPHLLKWILPLIEKQKKIRRFCFITLSEVGINYRKSTLCRDASVGYFPNGTPQPGDRLPYLLFTDNEQEVNIQEKINPTGFMLFVFTGSSSSAKFIEIVEKYKHVLSLETIAFTAQTKSLYHHFGIKDSGYYLIRPDMHIAFRSSTLDTRHLIQFLNSSMVNNFNK
jgi:2-polyprenyl-6-methoxyphenol hydroxylase-like FAD-dependent oxidoreductase